jgi:RNA polymerase sigma-70 factor, ECF subfamily
MSVEKRSTDSIGVRGWLDRARSGNCDAFAEAVRPLLASLHNVSFGILQNKADTEDVVQESLLKAWAHIGELREEANFRAWLIRITVTEALLRRKRAKRFVLEAFLRANATDLEGETVIAEAPDPRDTPEKDFERLEMNKAIHAAILKLPMLYRQVYILRDVQDLSSADTATVLNIGVEAVMTRLHRARLRMRSQLAPLFRKPGSSWLPISMFVDMGTCFVKRAVSCRFVTNALSSFLDDELDTATREQIERHLHLCRTCSLLMDTSRGIAKIIGDDKVFQSTPAQSERLYLAVCRKLGTLPASS